MPKCYNCRKKLSNMIPQEMLSPWDYALMLGKINVSQVMICSDCGTKRCDDCWVKAPRCPKCGSIRFTKALIKE